MLLYTSPRTRVRALKKMLRAGLVIYFAFVLSSVLTAQELSRSVVGSAGSYFSAVNVGNIHFTVGEIAIDRTTNGLILERGFHHGIYELLSTSVWSSPEINLDITVFPNPTADLVNLRGDWKHDDQLRVTDLLGRHLVERVLPLERAEVSLATYPSGTYFFTILREGRPLKSLRVIRR
ncbi:T9SS type A sorting domain-containing protein [Neolewinella persica]|uniref:T9SS type A sorting domain-containing protein n=1 Tax=Neolewinella persica TaxID=70998 RepID=UPI000364F017|nr:T9SS type A sorting domain-containing protein [Neolewinella persica]